MKNTYDIFLSHNRSDKAWTEKLAFDIENNVSGTPLKVFFDKWDIKIGDDIPYELEQGLKYSRFIGLVMTPEAFLSDWIVLESSTAIMRDPAARYNTILPLLRKNCDIPEMLKRLNYLDFTDDNNYNENLEVLINILRDRPIIRGISKSFEVVSLQEDQQLLQKHLKAFQRPLFRIPFIKELFPAEILDALDDTQAALNTGRLYSRNKNILSEYPSYGDFKTHKFRNGFESIVNLLTELKSVMIDFENLYDEENKGLYYFNNRNTGFMVMNLILNGDLETMEKSLRIMDNFDNKRNVIIEVINGLLANSNEKFEKIIMSSELIKSGFFGGKQSMVTKWLKHELPQEFNNINKDNEYLWAYQRFEEYVDNHFDMLSKSADDPNITRDEMLMDLWWQFKKHKDMCINWEKTGIIPSWTNKRGI